MPINIKNSGSWSNSTPLVKNSGSWSPAKQVFAKVNGVWQTVYTSAISDNFNRTNSATLGTVPETDYAWSDRRGLWQISGSAAYTSSVESSYPIADIEFGTQSVSVQTTVNATGTSQSGGKYGGGIAFWIVDSQNWWGAYNDVVRTGTSTYTCASTYNGKSLTSQVGTTCNYDYSATATTTPGTEFCSSGVGPVTSFARYNTSTGTTDQVKYNVCITASSTGQVGVSSPLTCTTYSGFKYYRPIGSGNDCYTSFNTISPSTTSPTTSYSCPSGGTLSGTTCLLSTSANETITYSYSHKLKLINAINNSIATVNTYTINDNSWIPANIKATINNNTITFNAYSNDDNTGSSWVDTYTAVNPNRGTKHGLLLAPKGESAVTQATALDNFFLSAV